MTSFVHVNHKVEKTMARPVIMVTRNIGAKEYYKSWWLTLPLTLSNVKTTRVFLGWQSNTLLVNGYIARNHSRTSPLCAYDTKKPLI